jgi:hypothetical protein
LSIGDLEKLLGDRKQAEEIVKVVRIVQKYCYYANSIDIGITYRPTDLSFSESLLYSWIKDGLNNGRKN